MRIGVLAPAEIALRRFMPALADIPKLEFAGVAVHTPTERFGTDLPKAEVIAQTLTVEQQRAEQFVTEYGGHIYPSYQSMIDDSSIEAIYLPLPPGLHEYWGRKVLDAGKHLLMEKPFTINAASTAELIALAKSKGLAIHENYMFAYHAQLAAIQQLIESGAIGQIRLIRIDFGFPRRAQNDFRYNKALGGGALLDAGGYPLRYATMLLGTKAKLLAATANYLPDAEVDMYGTAMLANDTGTTVQIGFGMDNAYRCDLNVWGSTGTLQTGRILTAPAGFTPTVEVIIANGKEIIELPDDDAFRNSIEVFLHCIANPEIREQRYQEIQQQADLVSQFQTVAGIA